MRRLILKLFRRRRLERDLEAELTFHEDMSRTRGNAIGLGNRTRVKEDARQVWRWQFVEDAWRDTAHGIRRLGQAPLFTTAAVLTLALAIGANAAIFTLVHRVVLNPLPYPDSERLIDLEHAAPGANLPSNVPMTLGLYSHYRERARTLEAIAIYDTGEATLTGSGEPERIRTASVTPTLDAVLGVGPLHGRWFGEADAEPGAPQTLILSHGFWMRRYGGQSDAVGQRVTLDGVSAEIIGVMPPSFAFPDPQVDLWAPVPSERQMVFDVFSHTGVARLRDGRSLSDARAELTELIRELPADYPETPSARGLAENARLRSIAGPLKDAVIGNVTRILSVLLGAVAFVLLVACANVANLFLVRSETQKRELAVRRALGAGRAALARYFVVEGMLVSAAGAILGIALAWSAVGLLTRFSPANLPRLEEIRLDGTVIAFAATLGLVTALALSVIPLLGATVMTASLHERARGSTPSARRHRVRHLLMGGQVALALMLFVAAGLMIRTFQNLRAIDPGFDPSSALTFRIGLPESEYPDTAAAVRAHQAILDSLSVIPGVTAASASTRIPLSVLSRGFTSVARVEGRVVPEDTIPPLAGFLAVAADYFETMGTPIRRGRGIDRDDIERASPVAVVSEAFVRAYFPGQDPIGARVARGSATVNSDWLTIVGIVADMPLDELPDATAAAAFPELYIPMSISGPQETPGRAANGPGVGAMSYVARSSTPPAGLTVSVRQAVDTIDPNLAIAQVRTLEDLVEGATSQTAFTMVLLAVAATSALLLGLVGIYGVVAYVVTQRTNEIGVRLALGARPGRVAAMIVGQAGVVTAAGILVGLGAALASGRLIESLLYGISPRDPLVLAVTPLLLLAVALLACWLPARRAARISPTDALRTE